MLKKGDWTAALSVEKRMYLALSEVLETTESMLDAVERQDQVSVRMYLNMRQEQVNQLRNCKDMLRKQCGALPKADGDLLRQVLSGGPAGDPEGEELCRQVCSPGGTTIEGIRSLEQNQVDQFLSQAFRASLNRDIELSK